MASATTRRFAGRLRRDRFPDPELSLGKHLQKLPNDLQVWDAVGPALALFDQLSLEIKNHLNKFGSSIKDEVRWTLCMVGRTRATSRPTVVFLSPDAGSRQAVKEQIKSSGILKSYPGFVTMDCNRPPGCAEMVSLGESNDDIDTTASDTDPTSRRHVATNCPGKAEGAVVIYAAHDGTDTGEQKRATAGGILRCGEELFVMTVAHIFPGYTQGVFPSTARSSEFEYGIDAWSDNEDTDMDIDDMELEQMSEASMSTPSSDSDDAQFWDRSQSAPAPEELEVNNNGDLSGSSTPTRGRRNPQSQVQKADEVGRTSNHVSDYPEDFSIDVEMKDGNLERITLQPILSLDSQGQFLDYALLPISSAQLDAFTGKFAKELQDPAKVPDASSSTIGVRSRTTVDVVAITASGGKISGQLLGTPTFMKRAHSENYQELWTVTLQTHLERGDSGLWIHDTKTGEVYGHLIAGSPGTGFGYVVPMVNVLEDLRGRFPGTWQIFTLNTDDVRSNIPSRRPLLQDNQDTGASPEVQDKDGVVCPLRRHETQGEKAYKAGDPRSRASLSASESRTPSLKVEPPSIGASSSGLQASPTESMTPRTSGSGGSSLTASSYSTITSSFQAVNFQGSAGSKRTASQAHLPESDSYPVSSPRAGPSSRPSRSYDHQMTNRNSFEAPGQSGFDEPYVEGGMNYTTTPQLPLLRIPEDNWIPGLFYNNSPWCSSASGSNYSTQSDGSRTGPHLYNRVRSLSVATLPDWSTSAAAPYWSHGMSNTPQDIRSPSFIDLILEPYETPFSSPQISTPVSTRAQLLNVPTSVDGFYNMELYLSSYWQSFHQLFPIIHQPTFDSTQSNLLTSAMAAIGTQYHDSTEARTKGAELNEFCKKGIELCPSWDLHTMQAILLTEVFTRFRGRKTIVRISRYFEALYSRLLSETDQSQMQVPSQSPAIATSTEALLDRFGPQPNGRAVPRPDDLSDWYQWLENEARQRLLSACFMFDVHQFMYHQQSRARASRDNIRSLICLPCPDNLWNATTPTEEWQTQRSGYIPQPLHQLEQKNPSQTMANTNPFTQSLIICWFASLLPSREDPRYPNNFLPGSFRPDIQNFMDFCPTSPHTLTYLALYNTPLHSLLAVASDTWVFAQKITPPSEFQDAQVRLKTWSTTFAAAQATHHACQVLSQVLSQPIPPKLSDGRLNTGFFISDYWSLYVSALICWAFGHKYQNTGNPSLSRSSSDGEITTVTVDKSVLQEEARLKALSYTNAMLELSVEDLWTNKATANTKGDTSGLIDAVRHRLEIESVGNKSGHLVDAVGVLSKIKKGIRGKWF